MDSAHPSLTPYHGIVVNMFSGFQEELMVVLRYLTGTESKLGFSVSMDLEEGVKTESPFKLKTDKKTVSSRSIA